MGKSVLLSRVPSCDRNETKYNHNKIETKEKKKRREKEGDRTLGPKGGGGCQKERSERTKDPCARVPLAFLHNEIGLGRNQNGEKGKPSKQQES